MAECLIPMEVLCHKLLEYLYHSCIYIVWAINTSSPSNEPNLHHFESATSQNNRSQTESKLCIDLIPNADRQPHVLSNNIAKNEILGILASSYGRIEDGFPREAMERSENRKRISFPAVIR